MHSNNMPNSAESTIYVGLDVHKNSISACVYDHATGQVCLEAKLPNDMAKMRKLVERIRERHGEPQCCYEASSCGYVLYRSLRALGVDCAVIAPSSMPRRPGERIKTDRRDAHKLATMYAAGMLSAVAVPDAGVEATRAMVRCREALVEDRVRCKQRVMALLLSLGLAYRQGAPWTGRFRQWVQALELSDASRATLETYLHQLDYLSSEIRAQEDRLAAEAEKRPYRDAVKVLMAFRGIDFVTALTLVCELGDIRRFGHPGALMAYLGLVPGERSSGEKSIRGPSPKRETHVPVRYWYLRPGSIRDILEPAPLCGSASRASHPRLSASRGRPNAGCTNALVPWRTANHVPKPTSPWRENWRVFCGMPCKRQLSPYWRQLHDPTSTKTRHSIATPNLTRFALWRRDRVRKENPWKSHAIADTLSGELATKDHGSSGRIRNHALRPTLAQHANTRLMYRRSHLASSP